MNRKIQREYAMNSIFQMELRKEYEFKAIENYIDEVIINEKEREYVKDIVKLFLEHKDSVDELIEKYLIDWKITRLPKVTLSILRLATTEILYFKDIPNVVSINEAIDLSKKFEDEESSKFINGVLGNLVNDLK